MSNNLPLRICCKNVVDVSFLLFKYLKNEKGGEKK